jgi:hypothetical protein
MAAQLTYVIFTGRLRGFANGRYFDIHALSGGGGGSTVHSGTPGVVNNPYLTGQKTIYKPRHIHGGAIPPGRYKICRPSKHAHLGLSARLMPRSGANMMGRGGFYIHGRGRHGSDGCIVPMEKFSLLMKALAAESVPSEGTEKKTKEKAPSKHDICGYLFVLEDEGGVRFA